MLESKFISKYTKPNLIPKSPYKDPNEIMYLTAGEIFRNKFMLTIKGTPQKSRMKVNQIVARLASQELETPWGMSKAISIKQLNDFNTRMIRLAESQKSYEEFMEHGVIRYHPKIIAKLAPVKDLSTITSQATLDQHVDEVSKQ